MLDVIPDSDFRAHQKSSLVLQLKVKKVIRHK
jgi:hypothetical protein